MHNLEIRPDNRPVEYFVSPVTVTDRDGREIAGFRSPRRLGRALVSGELVLLAGDTVIIRKIRVVS
jgi:hypothetical protein